MIGVTDSKGHMSPQTPLEEDDRLRRMFSKYDKDQSGGISKLELEKALIEARLPPSHAKEIFQEADSNHDGKIDYAEFSTFVTKKELILKSTFEQFDKSKTGFITREVSRWGCSPWRF